MQETRGALKAETRDPTLPTEILMQLLKNFWKDEDGATMVEYALLIALVAVSALGALNMMGTSITELFTYTGTAMEDALPESSSSSS